MALDVAFQQGRTGKHPEENRVRGQKWLKGRAPIFLRFTLVCAVAVFAENAGAQSCATGTINYTVSTKTYTTTTPVQTVTNTVQTYSTEIQGTLNGNIVYDQTLSAAFSDPSVQAALISARAAITSAGGSNISGPSLIANSTAQVSSTTDTTYTTTGTNVTTATTQYIGPQTIQVGDNQSQTFILCAGQMDFDTLTTTQVLQTQTNTVTNTMLTSQRYLLAGTRSLSP